MNKPGKKDPSWWSEEHTSAWDRVKAAFRRDWEQTKNDLTRSKGKDLDQDVPDTVKQALGKDPIPPGNQPNPPDADQEWERVEAGTRFGYGARHQFGKDNDEWNESVESKLREEWNRVGSSERWDEARARVQSGWERAKPGDFRG